MPDVLDGIAGGIPQGHRSTGMSSPLTIATPDEAQAEKPTKGKRKRRPNTDLRAITGHWADISLLKLQRPEILKTIIYQLGLKRPIREIASHNRVSGATVLAVLNDPEHAPKIQARREHFTTQARNALQLGIERTVEEWSDPLPPVFK